VAFGTTLSAFWIIALNSWMQTPQGFEMINGQAHATSWLEIIFNPSMPYRLAHMLTASFLTASFVLIGISCYRIARQSKSPVNAHVLKISLTAASVLVPLQILLGDLHGQNTLQYQPAKLAAMEGIWNTQKNVPAILFAIPDQKTQSNLYEVAIPNLASLYLTHTWDGEVKGLNEFPNQTPPVAPVFFAFRIMVGVGLLMLMSAWLGRWYLYKRNQMPMWLTKSMVWMTFSGWVGVVAGWYVTEIGRQPFLVSGILRTADAVTNQSSGMVFSTLLLYLILYFSLLSAYVWTVFYMARRADSQEGNVQQNTPNISTSPYLKVAE
jgi:cytochrome d ubiquinol oxidase subunit I